MTSKCENSEARLRRPRPLEERVVSHVLGACAVLCVATTAGIIAVLLTQSVAFFKGVSLWQFLCDTQWTPLFTDKHFGIWALVCGTLLTSVIALAVAVPLGLLGAVYLSEYASQTVRHFLKPAVEVLAGIPTVIYGYFALTFITPILQKIVPGLAGFNALGSGVVMGIMILPIIASLSEDAIHAVPSSLREGAYALGGGKFAAIRRVVLPTSFSGIAAAVIIGMSRAVGETMIVAIAAGQQPRFTLDPRVPIETMTAYIVQVSMGDTPTGTLEYHTIFAVGMMLFIVTMTLNIASYYLRKRMTRGAAT
ncbi:MAG: phosphate ABC transporter permease subunit PstC [Planctomycetes bacterium]|nr:phosphate ABC transporter permease subunit PstC [Planctomycetota bacterium]